MGFVPQSSRPRDRDRMRFPYTTGLSPGRLEVNATRQHLEAGRPASSIQRADGVICNRFRTAVHAVPLAPPVYPNTEIEL